MYFINILDRLLAPCFNVFVSQGLHRPQYESLAFYLHADQERLVAELFYERVVLFSVFFELLHGHSRLPKQLLSHVVIDCKKE